jgi:spore maturation protein CgeB
VAEHLERLTPERARSIGHAALARVLAEHTYELRGHQVHALFQQHAARTREAA